MDVNKLRREAQKLTGKAETFLKGHHDQIESTVTKAETFAKSKTKNQKRDQQIDKVAGKLRNLIPAEPSPDTTDTPEGAKKPKAAGADKPHAPGARKHPKADGEGEPGPSGLG